MEVSKKYGKVPHMPKRELEALIEQKSKGALEAVEHMSKHPLSPEQMLEQEERISKQIEDMQNIKKKSR